MARVHWKSLQGARGLAASIVLLMHLPDLTANFSPEPWATISRYMAFWGHAGVDVFFVLSGTIMCLVTGNGMAAGSRLAMLGEFVVKRAARLYPVFLATFVFSAWVRIGVQGAEWPTPVAL